MQEKIPELVVPSLEGFEVASDTHFIIILLVLLPTYSLIVLILPPIVTYS